MSDTCFCVPEENSIEYLLRKTENGILNAEIYTALFSDSNLFNFRIAKKDSEILGVIYNNGDNFLFSAFCGSFFDEAKDFFAFSGNNVFSSDENLKKLNLPESGIYILKGKKELHKSEARLLTGREIQNMYKAISGNSCLSADEEIRYVRYMKAINASLAAVFGIEKDGKFVSFAAVSASNRDTALIGDVFTLPEHRKKGFGAECVKACINFCAQQNKTPFVFCEEKNKKFYENLNFEVSYVGM